MMEYSSIIDFQIGDCGELGTWYDECMDADVEKDIK
jgi:hypothetical protein